MKTAIILVDKEDKNYLHAMDIFVKEQLNY